MTDVNAVTNELLSRDLERDRAELFAEYRAESDRWAASLPTKEKQPPQPGERPDHPPGPRRH